MKPAATITHEQRNDILRMSFTSNQDGIALLIILWVLAILSVLALSFSYVTRTETHAALSFRKGVERKFLAEAGVERGIMEIFYRNANKNLAVVMEGKEVWKTDGTKYTVQADNSHSVVGITDESGKVDINSTPEVILRNLLGQVGLNTEDIDTITDSVMDWKDADDLHRLHGAENDYYLSLPLHYKARNANFETLEELLLVKGITPEILYGNSRQKGLMDFLTVHTKTGKINLNAASREVLLSVPGMSSDLAEAIIAARQTGDIQNIQSVLGQSYAVMAPYVDVTGAGIFTIDAEGYAGAEQAGYGIKTIVYLNSNNKVTHLYYKSPVETDHARDNNGQ